MTRSAPSVPSLPGPHGDPRRRNRAPVLAPALALTVLAATLDGTGAAAAQVSSQSGQPAAHHRHRHHHAGPAHPHHHPHPDHSRPAARPVPHSRHAGLAPHRHAMDHHYVMSPRHAALAAGAAAGAIAGTAGTGAAGTGTPAAPAAPPAPPDKGTVTGLPLPRFAALRADEVNMRSGPGQRYPIEWVYHRRDLPVKIEREFDVWRLVEDSDGQKGWVHQATLVGARTFVVPGLPPVDPAQARPAHPASGDAAPQSALQSTSQSTSQPAPQPASGGHFDTRVVARLADPAAAAAIPGAIAIHASPDASSALVAVLRPGAVGTFRLCAAGTEWCKVSVQHYSGWLDRRAVWGLLPQETIQPS